MRLGEQDFEAVISQFTPGRYLVRAASEGVLAERFAGGEVTEEEYRARLEVLRARP